MRNILIDILDGRTPDRGRKQCPNCSARIDKSDFLHGTCPVCNAGISSGQEPDIEREGAFLPDGLDMLKQNAEDQMIEDAQYDARNQ